MSLGLVSTCYMYNYNLLLTRSFLSTSTVAIRYAQPKNSHIGFRFVNLCTCLALWRFLYFHGQPHARLLSHQTVYSEPGHEISLIFTLFSIIFFSVPGECLRDIKKLWTDDLITATAWENFMKEKIKEWTDLILPVMQVGLTRYFH